jgi:hypothetical protein
MRDRRESLAGKTFHSVGAVCEKLPREQYHAGTQSLCNLTMLSRRALIVRCYASYGEIFVSEVWHENKADDID